MAALDETAMYGEQQRVSEGGIVDHGRRVLSPIPDRQDHALNELLARSVQAGGKEGP
jgi:hypothetical protein